MSGTCRSCDRERIARWNLKNRDRANETRRKWREDNPDKYAEELRSKRERSKAARGFEPLSAEEKREKRRAYNRAYRVRSERERLLDRLRKRVHKALAGSVRLGRTRQWIGCTPAELVAHLEAQFQPGMTWENRGEWHVDHIKPLVSFDLSDPEQRLQACHYTNLQPLWAADNLAKGARLDWAA